jgi:hypothetical protein
MDHRQRVTDGGQPGRASPERLRSGLPDQRNNPAVSPLLRPGPNPGQTNPEPSTGPVRQSHRVATVQSRAPARASLTLPGPHPGVGPGTCGTPGPANRAAEPGIKARAAAHSASNRARTAPDVQGFHPAEGSGNGSASSTTKKDSESSAPAGKASGPGPRRDTQSGTGPRDPEPASDHMSQQAASPDCKLHPGKPGPGIAPRRDSPVALRGQRSSSTRIITPRCNSGQAQSVKFEPPLHSKFTCLVTHGLGGI